jgi:hypothetical protein
VPVWGDPIERTGGFFIELPNLFLGIPQEFEYIDGTMRRRAMRGRLLYAMTDAW